MHTPPSPASTPAASRWRQAVALLAAAVGLGGVLLLYSQPGFLVMLSDMIWACFG